MTKITPSLILAAIPLMLGFQAAPAHAQIARTYVSSFGSDANNCDRPTPCRTFQRAHNQTLANGEITVLDPGGYGAVTITKNISIINDGVGEAGALVSGGGTGITVSAPADAAVSLRGLTIKGIGWGGGNGIVFISGKSLSIENCVVRNLTDLGFGILFQPSSGASSLLVSNTLVADNSNNGIWVSAFGSATVKAALDGVEVYNNSGHGVLAAGQSGSTGTIDVTVSDSVSAGNVAGFTALSSNGATSLMLADSVAANNLIGVWAFNSGATVRMGESTITGNTASWLNVGGSGAGTVSSYGDNNIDGNGDAPEPVPPKIPTK
jgi:hypothetical protein